MIGLIVVSTVTLAAIYALIGIGFVVMFRATGVLSFAQGSFFLIGTLMFYTLTNSGLGLYTGLIVAALIVGVLGALSYLAIFQFASFDLLFVSLATVGLGGALEAASNLLWAPDLFRTRHLVSSHAHRLGGGFTITDAQIISIGIAIVLIVGVSLFIYRTPIGLRMRAVAADSVLAAYGGVRVRRISALSWGIAAGVAAAAGIGYTLGSVIDPSALPAVGLVVFPAIIIGGLDSLGGVAAGSIILALVQTLASVYVGAQWSDMVSYSLLLVLLWVRPTGLFGSHQMARV